MTIYQLRIQAGLTQAELAKRVGCSQSSVAQYETGRRSPRLKTAVRIVEALGLKKEAIFDLMGYDKIIGKNRQEIENPS